MSKIQKNLVFIDNDINNWNNDMDFYDKTVDYIRVPNFTRNTESRYTKRLAKNGNQYAAALLRTDSRNFVNRGIDKRVVNQLKKWSFLQTHKQKYALFDWDGTISATEGFSIEALSRPMSFTSPMMDFLLPTYHGGRTKNQRKTTIRLTRFPPLRQRSKRNLSSESSNTYHFVSGVLHNKKQKTRKHRNPTLQEMVESQEYQTARKQPLIIHSKEFLDDMFVYLMRPERVELLRDLFRTLLSNGVQVHIFTHNPYASTANPYRKIFIEMISRLFDSREDLDIQGVLHENMLHSTIDYTNPGEPANNSFASLSEASALARGVRGLSGEDPSGLRRENALKRNILRGLGLVN